MIKTAMGLKINPETFQEKIKAVVAKEIQLELECQIELPENDQLLIFINSYSEDILTKIINLIKEIIADYKITDYYSIVNIENQDIVYFSSVNGSENNQDLSNVIENIEDGKASNTFYKSANFSAGFIIFILGVISLTIFGVTYYFTRPCVLGTCTLITDTEVATNNLFNQLETNNLTDSKIKELIADLVQNIETLKTIPSWSKEHDQAQMLISSYQEKINDLQLFLDAKSVATNAQNMSEKLPLSLDEWLRVKQFWQDAIAPLNKIKSEEFNEFKTLRINSYQQQLSFVNKQIEKENLAINKRENAEKIVAQIKEENDITNSLEALKEREKKWKSAIQEIEQIPPQTEVYQEKEEIINDYLQQISEVQKKITIEENALNLKKNIEEKMKSAQEQEKRNQWTKAVNLWQEAINLTDSISPDSWLKDEIEKQKNEAEGKLEIAQGALKKAVKREEIKTKLREICQSSEKICSYTVSDSNIKVYLTDEYIQKITSLSVMSDLTNNNEQEKQIINHINQVEKNYQYISSKYQIPVEIYNPQQKLIMIYNSYL
ncbi:hypothetical protein H6G11_05530 [Cyanobacterium aponinum FACHB-4101]|uniref:hypothetical protein n=1 Tax=Cyanobacterium aponinum TaxID=379064 RepID=UPI0016804892|nr:hypothetical protein [Cyanobacterium aponinum]MBD2393715.1 hypothetical protein [Cyanobacterium aponinum FACHB-4101]